MICDSINNVAYIKSNWVPAWLPIQYKFSTNKWPVNTFDAEDTITSVSDANGFARVVINSASVTYVEKEYIKIAGSTVSSYDGVWQILQLHSTTDFTISANYNGNDSGNTFQRYYNNYHFKFRVYAGIPSGHFKESDDPMALRGTEDAFPNSSNLAIVDISSYIRRRLSPIENDLCSAVSASNAWMGNDSNMWSSFYISYAESYDTVTSGEVTTYTSTYQDDMKDIYDLNLKYASNSAKPFQNFQGKSIGEYAIFDTNPEEVEAKWMTLFDSPTYFRGLEYDLSIIIAYTEEDLVDGGFFLEYVLTEYDENGTQLNTETAAIDREGEGLYRFAFSEYPFQSSTETVEIYLQKSSGEKLSETKTVKIATSCNKIYLRWLNQPGGWDGWEFQARNDKGLDVRDRKIVRRNIYNDFDTDFVYGTTQDDYYDTEAYETRSIATQWLTRDEVENLALWLKTSNKVQEIFTSDESGCTRYKHRTVLIDRDSFIYLPSENKLYSLNFTYRYTDQMILQGQ